MNAITLHAHFDGEKIVLDEPFELEPNTQLVVTVLPEPSDGQTDEERGAWYRWAMEQFAKGYDDDEPEYTLDMIKEWNPEYDRR